MTNRFGKTTGCHTTLAETVILDDEETAIDDCKFTHNNSREIHVPKELKPFQHPYCKGGNLTTVTVVAV